MTTDTLFSRNGEIRPLTDAVVPVLSPAVKYGIAVFDTVRGYWNDEAGELFLFRLDDHLGRLRRSAEAMGFDPLPDEAALKDWIFALLQALEMREDCGLRIQVFPDVEDGAMTARGPLCVTVTARARGRTAKAESGVTCGLSSWTRISGDSMPPRIKVAANYHNGRLALLEVQAAGYDQAIFLNRAGTLAEGALACLFLVREGRAVTPDLESDILESVTRDTVLTLLPERLGVPCTQEPVAPQMLSEADEIFFCSTGLEILPVVAIDGRAIGNGEPGTITRRLQADYLAVARGTDTFGADWRSPVHGAANG